MKRFGERTIFAIEYTLHDKENGFFEMWVHGAPICCYLKNNVIQPCRCNLLSIGEWLSENISNLLNEKEFPLPVMANTSIDFYNRSGDFNSDDMDEFDKWYEKRQEWYFGHSWYSNRAGSYLAEVLFRRVGNEMEIEWDNTGLYEEVNFVNPKGLYYVDIALFQKIVDEFVLDFNTCKRE